MRRLAPIALLLCLACKPKAQTSPGSEPPQASEWQASEAQPSELQRIACYGALAIEVIRYTNDVQKSLNAWYPAALPLLPQFKFTPWADIPANAQVRIQTLWTQVHRESVAKQAIELQVPLSSMVCKPEYPNCDQFNPADSGVVYSKVLIDQLAVPYEGSAELSHGIEIVRIAVNSGLNSTILSAVGEQYERISTVRKGLIDFFELLPPNAVLPPLEWPKEKPKPHECDDVIKQTK